MAPKMPLSRREFVKDAGGLLIGFSLVDAAMLPRLLAAPADDAVLVPTPGRLDGWLRIEKDETIRVFTGKAEIGMGVQTALSQIVAEELDAPFEHISFVMADTAITPDQGGVGGSTSVAQGGKPLRNAAATARLVLLQLASQRLGVPVEQLQVKNGVVSVKSDACQERLVRRSRGLARPARGPEDHGRRFRPQRRGRGQAQGAVHLHGRGTADSARGHAAQGSRAIQLRRRRARSRDAAWARGAAGGRRIDAQGRGRKLGQANSGNRQGRRERQFCRRGRADRMGRHPRRTSAQGLLDRSQSRLPRSAGVVPASAHRDAQRSARTASFEATLPPRCPARRRSCRPATTGRSSRTPPWGRAAASRTCIPTA